jgi:hypothetical protein
LRIVFHYIDRGLAILQKRIPIYRVKELAVRADLMRMRFDIPNDDAAGLEALTGAIDAQMDGLLRE